MGTNDDTNFIDTSTDAGRDQLRQENQDALDNLPEDQLSSDRDLGQPRQQRDEQEQRRDPETNQPVVQSPGDQARKNIAARFRREESVPFSGDINDPEMTIGEIARRAEEPEPGTSPVGGQRDPALDRQTQQQPQKRKLTVRGQELELTDEEILARAAKVTAADSYLEEARTILEEAKTIRAERNSPSSRRPESQNDTQDDLNADDDTNRSQHPEDDMEEVIESIQYRDPKEAARKLSEAIDKRADKKADERQLQRLMDNDLQKSQKALKDFMVANAELGSDKMTARAIEATLYDIYEEDIVKLGLVDADQIPKDAAGKANWHRFYRVHGHPVRTAAEALEEAKTRVLRWKGNPAPSNGNEPRPAPSKTQPRVNVDRTERRMAIPNSPSRSVAPAKTEAPKATSRSDVIAKMRASRGQVVA